MDIALFSVTGNKLSPEKSKAKNFGVWGKALKTIAQATLYVYA